MRHGATGICLREPSTLAAAVEIWRQQCLFALPPVLMVRLVRQLPMLVWLLLVP
jgi:hypothetical protein